MFIPRARVRLTRPGGSGRNAKQLRRRRRRKLNFFELIRMPCLFQTILASALGLLILFGGAAMSGIGYNPAYFLEPLKIANSTKPVYKAEPKYYLIKAISYIGPIFMGVGLFVMIVACVLYCEIKDKYINVIPPRAQLRSAKKSDLYEKIVLEFRKNYFRGMEVPLKHPGDAIRTHPTLFKALSLSTPALLLTPEFQRKWKSVCDSSLRHIAIGKGKSVQFEEPRRHETWLKTSSLPSILPLESRRASTGCVHNNRIPKVRKALSFEPFSSSVDRSGFDNLAYATEREIQKERARHKMCGNTRQDLQARTKLKNFRANHGASRSFDSAPETCHDNTPDTTTTTPRTRDPHTRDACHILLEDNPLFDNFKDIFSVSTSKCNNNHPKHIGDRLTVPQCDSNILPSFDKNKLAPKVSVQMADEATLFERCHRTRRHHHGQHSRKHPLVAMRETASMSNLVNEDFPPFVNHVPHTSNIDKNTSRALSRDSSKGESDVNILVDIPTSDESFSTGDNPIVIVHQASVHCENLEPNQETKETDSLLVNDVNMIVNDVTLIVNNIPMIERRYSDNSLIIQKLNSGGISRIYNSIAKMETTDDASNQMSTLKADDVTMVDPLHIADDSSCHFDKDSVTKPLEEVS